MTKQLELDMENKVKVELDLKGIKDLEKCIAEKERLAKDCDMWNKEYNEQFNKAKRFEQILNKIEKIVNNKDITGIEAKLMIIDILNEIKEGNDNK